MNRTAPLLLIFVIPIAIGLLGLFAFAPSSDPISIQAALYTAPSEMVLIITIVGTDKGESIEVHRNGQKIYNETYNLENYEAVKFSGVRLGDKFKIYDVKSGQRSLIQITTYTYGLESNMGPKQKNKTEVTKKSQLP